MNKNELLHRIFGYSSFRSGQEKLIDAVLAGQDVFGIMPTGGGKSICYQIPALILPGITLVISPLISLMQDQVAHGVGLGRQKEDLVKFAVDLLPQLCVEAENGNRLMKQVQQLLILIGQPRHGFWQAELDDQSLAGIACGILGAVQRIGTDADDVEGL